MKYQIIIKEHGNVYGEFTYFLKKKNSHRILSYGTKETAEKRIASLEKESGLDYDPDTEYLLCKDYDFYSALGINTIFKRVTRHDLSPGEIIVNKTDLPEDVLKDFDGICAWGCRSGWNWVKRKHFKRGSINKF